MLSEIFNLSCNFPMNIMKSIISASVLASSAVFAQVEHSDPTLQKLSQAFSEAERNHDKVSAAYSLAEQTVKARPTDPIALAYKGSLSTQVARDAIFPWTRLTYLRKGIDIMDQAIDLALRAPINPIVVLEVRMVRALTSARIPSIFGRGAVARSDLNHILSNPGFKDMPAHDQASVYAWLAVYAHRASQAEKTEDYLKKAGALDQATASGIWSER